MKSSSTSLIAQSIFVLFCLIMSISSFFFVRMLTNTQLYSLSDFDVRAFYTGGQMVAHHVTQNFYTNPVQYHWQKQYFALPSQKSVLPFVYPSFVGIPYATLSSLPVEQFYKTLAFINVLLAITAFYFILFTQRIFSSRLITMISCLIFLFYVPFWNGLMQVQLSFILFLSLVVSWMLLKKQRTLAAGLWLSLLFVRPNLIILPILVLLYKREWNVLLGIVTGGLILLLICMLTTGPDFLWQYSRMLFSYDELAQGYTHPQIEATIRGFFQSLFKTNTFLLVAPYYFLGSILTLWMLMRAWGGHLMPKTAHFDQQWAVLIIAMILTSVHTNPHDLLLILFPILISATTILQKLTRTNQPPWRKTLVIALILLIIIMTGIACTTPLIISPLLFFFFCVLLRQTTGNFLGIFFTTKP